YSADQTHRVLAEAGAALAREKVPDVPAVELAELEPAEGGEHVMDEVPRVRVERARLDLGRDLDEPSRGVVVESDVAVDHARCGLARLGDDARERILRLAPA